MRPVIDAARDGVKRAARHCLRFLRFSRASPVIDANLIVANRRMLAACQIAFQIILSVFFACGGYRAMLRFIVLTFAFLGWAFFELSGGTAYQPRDGSRQAVALEQRALQEGVRLAADQTPQVWTTDQTAEPIILASADTAGLRVVSDAAAPAAQLVGADKTLALQSQGIIDRRIENLSLAAPSTFAQGAAYATAAATVAPVTQDLRDLRQITGAGVNMRAGPGTSFGVLSRLTRNTQVEVLETQNNGWIRLRDLDSKRVGWVAAKFVSRPADRG